MNDNKKNRIGGMDVMRAEKLLDSQEITFDGNSHKAYLKKRFNGEVYIEIDPPLEMKFKVGIELWADTVYVDFEEIEVDLS